MASDADFTEFVCEQMSDAGAITSRKMFGEYGVYCNGKIIGFVCDNQLFVKPTKSGGEFIGEVTKAPPYPGAKMYLLIEDRLEDRQWLSRLINLTWKELLEPKPRNPRGKSSRKK